MFILIINYLQILISIAAHIVDASINKIKLMNRIDDLTLSRMIVDKIYFE